HLIILSHNLPHIFTLLPFFFNDTATTEIYTLSYTTLFRSINGKLPSPQTVNDKSYPLARPNFFYTNGQASGLAGEFIDFVLSPEDRKSTRLNSSHVKISYAVFCLKKKKKNKIHYNK